MKNRIITVMLFASLKKGDSAVQTGCKSSTKACASVSIVSVLFLLLSLRRLWADVAALFK